MKKQRKRCPERDGGTHRQKRTEAEKERDAETEKGGGKNEEEQRRAPRPALPAGSV